MAVDASEFLPQQLDLAALREAAADCRGCDLWQLGTQTVFGEGPPDARMMFVGEAPGEREDRAGHPFVGPAGRELDKALEDVGLGATAAKSLLGSAFRLTAQRGEPIDSDLAPVVLATIHPSAILRGRDGDARQAQRELFTEDLRVAAAALTR